MYTTLGSACWAWFIAFCRTNKFDLWRLAILYVCCRVQLHPRFCCQTLCKYYVIWIFRMLMFACASTPLPRHQSMSKKYKNIAVHNWSGLGTTPFGSKNNNSRHAGFCIGSNNYNSRPNMDNMRKANDHFWTSRFVSKQHTDLFM